MNRPICSLLLVGTLSLGVISQAFGIASLPPTPLGYTPKEVVAAVESNASLTNAYESELGLKRSALYAYLGGLHATRTRTSLQTQTGILAANTAVLADTHDKPVLLASDGSLIHLVSMRLSTASVASMASASPLADTAAQNPSANDLVAAPSEAFSVPTQQPTPPSSRKQDFGQKVFNSVLGGFSVPWLGLVTHNGGNASVQPAPEPMSTLVLFSGIVGLIGSHLRRKR